MKLRDLKTMVKDANNNLQNAETIEQIESAEKSMRSLIDHESHKLFTVRIQSAIDSIMTSFELFEKHRITCVELGQCADDFCAKIDAVLQEQT